MGFQIANDADSVSKRASSVTGFIDEDLPLLRILRVVEKKKGAEKVNNNLVQAPEEIRDFLTWASGDKKVPLPPLARRILCLKRAIIKNSIASVGTSLQQRTGEKKQLEEIDAILRSDGVTDPDSLKQCETEGSKWVPIMHAGVDPAPAVPPQAPTTTSGPGCTTTVNCDSSALVSILNDIKGKLEKINGKGNPNDVNLTPLTTILKSIEYKINKLPKRRCQCPMPTIPMGTHIKNKAGRTGTVIKYKLKKSCSSSENTNSPQFLALENIERPLLLTNGNVNPPPPPPPGVGGPPPPPPGVGGPPPPPPGVGGPPPPPPGVGGPPPAAANPVRVGPHQYAVGGGHHCQYKLIVKWDDDGTTEEVNPLDVEYSESNKKKFKIGDIVSRTDGEALTPELNCKKGKIIGFEPVEGEEVAKIECIGDEPLIQPTAPFMQPPPPPPMTPVNEPRSPVSGGQRGGVQSVRVNSPRVSLYKQADITLVQEDPEGVRSNLSDVQKANCDELIAKLESLTPVITELKPIIEGLQATVISGGRTMYNKIAELKALIQAQNVSVLKPLLEELVAWTKSGFKDTLQPITEKLAALQPVLDKLPVMESVLLDIQAKMAKGEDVTKILDAVNALIAPFKPIPELLNDIKNTLDNKFNELKPMVETIPELKAALTDIQTKMAKNEDITQSLQNLTHLIEGNAEYMQELLAWTKTGFDDGIESIKAKVNELKPILDTIPEVKTIVADIQSRITPADQILPLLTSLSQEIKEHGVDQIGEYVQELLAWTKTGFKEDIQGVTQKLDEIPLLKTLVEDIKTNVLSGGQTLNAKIAALKTLLETIKAPAPIAIENANNVAPENVAKLNAIQPLVALIPKLDELAAKVDANAVSIDAVKRLLESYQLGETKTMLLKVQNLLDTHTQEFGNIKNRLEELKPHIDDIPALKALVSSIQETMAKGADVTSQLSGLQTMLTSYKLDTAAPLLEELKDMLKANTVEAKLEEVKEGLGTILSQLYEDPSSDIKTVQAAVLEIGTKLDDVNRSLSEQLAGVKEDTTAIKAGVNSLSANTKGRDELLLAKIAEQTAMIEELKSNLGDVRTEIGEYTKAELENTEYLKIKLKNLKKLIEATHTPETEEAAITRVLEVYDAKLGEKLAGLRNSNAKGKNEAAIARVAELEGLVAGLRARLEEENKNKGALQEKTARIEELTEQLATLRAAGNTKNGTIRELTQQSADRQAQIDAKKAEIALIREEMAAMHGNHKTELADAERIANKLRDEKKHLIELKDRIQAQLDSASGENKTLLKEKAENERLLNEATASLAKVEAQRAACQDALDLDDQQIGEVQDLLRQAQAEMARRNEGYRADADLVREETDALIASLAAAKNSTGKNAVLREANEKLIGEQKAQIATLSARVAQLEQEKLDGHSACEREKAELVLKKGVVAAELAQARSELASGKGRVAELEPEVERLRARLAEFEGRGGPGQPSGLGSGPVQPRGPGRLGQPENFGAVANPFSNRYVPPPANVTNYTRNKKNKRTRPQKYTQENLRVLKDGLKSFIKYANKGGSNSLIPDVDGIIFDLQGSFNNKSYQNFRVAWSKLMQSPTGRAIADVPGSPVAPYKNIERILPNTYEEAFHNLVQILTVVPESVSGYKTRFGGLRRTIKKTRDYRKAQ